MTLAQRYYQTFVRQRILQDSEKDAEIAHERGLEELEKIEKSPWRRWLITHLLSYSHPMLETSAMGIDFSNPLGLSAGFDKNARVYSKAIPAFGWGFETLGAVLRHPQKGNPRPRMWRSEKLQALCNWLGFNSDGLDTVLNRMSNTQAPPIPVILNVGKNKETPVEQALEDYVEVVRRLWLYVHAIELNPSSPNTPGLREFQNREILRELLKRINGIHRKLRISNPNIPILPLGVKLSPDESDEQLQDILDVCIEKKVSFLTLTNTTVSRDNIHGWNIPSDRGGVSGSPLKMQSLHILQDIHKELKRRKVRDQFTLISVGGISNGLDMLVRLANGANLCAVLTAWTFQGPDFVKQCLEDLVRRLQSEGYDNISEVVGAAP